MTSAPIPCPFVYTNGKRCTGHVSRIGAYKAGLSWNYTPEGWRFTISPPRSHYHVFCSEKDNHAGFGCEDALKFYYEQLPSELQAIMGQRGDERVA